MSKSLFAFVFLAFTPTIAVSTPQAHGSGLVVEEGIEIPFEVGPRGHILIDVAIDGHDPVLFALDTGAGRTVLNKARLGALGLEDRASGDVLQGAHGRAAMGLTEVESLSIGDVAFGRLELGTMDLTRVEGGDMTLFGVVGFDVLSRFDVILDFVGHTVGLHPRADDLAACVACEGEISVPFALVGGTHIQMQVSISDQPITAVLDTGSGRTGMNRLAAQAIGIEVPASLPGNHAPALRVGEIHLGDGVLARDVIVGVVDLPAFGALGMGDGPALLIGTGTLTGRRVGISYGLQRLSIR